MRVHHFFDWDGLIFATKMVLFLVVVVAGGRFALQYAAGPRSSPSVVLIQETHPAPIKSLALSLSTTTSEHIIRTLAVSDAVPAVGKFIVADLSTMVLTLYESGTATTKYPILATGAVGSPYETPAGFYTVLTKESDHFDTGEQVDLPWSVQFSGNYSIHGWPFAADGSPVDSSYTGGDIRLSSADAKNVHDFAESGTAIFVYAPVRAAPPSLVLDVVPAPKVSAVSYVVADIDTGDVYLEQNAGAVLPAAGATKLMAALAANETTPFDIRNNLKQASRASGLIGWMNAKAGALDMSSTHFVDTSSTSTENVSDTDDLFRLASYLTNGKSFILDADAASDTRNMVVSVFSVPINGVVRQVAIIVLQSDNATADTIALSDWFTRSAAQGADLANTACITCAIAPPYRKIQL